MTYEPPPGPVWSSRGYRNDERKKISSSLSEQVQLANGKYIQLYNHNNNRLLCVWLCFAWAFECFCPFNIAAAAAAKQAMSMFDRFWRRRIKWKLNGIVWLHRQQTTTTRVNSLGIFPYTQVQASLLVHTFDLYVGEQRNKLRREYRSR